MNNLFKFIFTITFLLYHIFSLGQIHVMSTRTGNGSGNNWNNAMSYEDLVNEINSITYRTRYIEIKFHRGSFLATKSIDFKDFLKVTISGGYSYEIDPETGSPIEITSADASLSVVDGQNFTKLFKFENNLEVELKTFTAQNANTTTLTEKGSCISIINSPLLNLKLENLIFKGNNLSNTSSVFINNINELKTDFVQFNDNRALIPNNSNGSALYIENLNKVTLENTTFKNNFTSSNGAALYLKNINEVKLEQIVGNNTASANVYNFDNNISLNNGGAIYNDNSNINLTAIYFKDNQSSKNGGAIYSTINSKNYLNRIHFMQNSAKVGGAIYNESNSDFKILSSLFYNNNATDYAGAIYNKKSLLITNATIVNNSNSAIVYDQNSTNTIYNSIFYLNRTNSSVFKRDISPETIGSNSAVNDIRNNIVEDYPPTQNITGDPEFVNNTSNFTLQITSPAFNTGSELLFQIIAGGATSLFHDLDKRNRNYGLSVDMGAYELTFDMNTFFPDCPQIISPQHMEENIELQPDIFWYKVRNANQYKLKVLEESNSSIVVSTDIADNNIGGSSSISYTEMNSDLKPNTWYNINIFPENTLIGISKEACPIYRFKTKKVPTVPECTNITLPVNNEKNVSLNPTIKWNKVDNATSYRLIIGTTPNGNDIFDEDVGNVDSFILSIPLSHSSTYYVQVIAINSIGPATSCSSISFETLIPPDPCEQVKLSLKITKNEVVVNVINGNKPIKYRIDNREWMTSNTFNDVSKGLHKIEIITAEGCTKEILFEIPNFYNLISPNGDGKNDEIDFSFLKLKQNASLLIVDRFGKTIFKDKGENNFIWKGKQSNGMYLPSDTYWYFIEWSELNSETINKLQGWILLKNK